MAKTYQSILTPKLLTAEDAWKSQQNAPQRTIRTAGSSKTNTTKTDSNKTVKPVLSGLQRYQQETKAANNNKIAAQMFDQNQNYIDKAKQGNYTGAALNFLGTGIQAPQSLYLNTLNNANSLATGKGVQPFKYNMTFTDYENAVADRYGTPTITQSLSNISKPLGTAYNVGMNIATDPLNLLDAAGATKALALRKEGSTVYNANLAAGKLLNQTLPVAKTRQVKMPVLNANGKVKNQKVTLPINNNSGFLGQVGDTFQMNRPQVVIKGKQINNAQDFAKLSEPDRLEAIKQVQNNAFPGIDVYRGYGLSNNATERNLSKSRNIMDVIGRPNKEVDLLPLEYYTESPEIAQKYASLDTTILEDIMRRTGKTKEEATKTFKIMYGKDPVSNGIVKQHKINPKKVLDLTDLGENANYEETIRKLLKAEGSDVPKWNGTSDNINSEKWKNWNRIEENIMKNVADYEQDTFPTYMLMKSKYAEDQTGRNFINWLKENNYDAVKYSENGTHHYALLKDENVFSNVVQPQNLNLDTKLPQAKETALNQNLQGKLPRANEILQQKLQPKLNTVQRALPVNPKFKDLGADVTRQTKTTEQLVNEYGAFPKGEAPRAREINVPKKTDLGAVQQHVRTLLESPIVDDTLAKSLQESVAEGSMTKFVKGNKNAVEEANNTLKNDGLDKAVERFQSVYTANKQPTSYDVALGYRTVQELQNVGRYDEAQNVAINLVDALSETGRTLQAARIAKRLSPEGRLMIATRAAQKVAKKTGKDVKLSNETAKLISDAATEKEIIEANNRAAIEIWNQTPANWKEKADAWRYMSMLTNPKTHIRNVVGNALFVPTREFKNLIGAGLERKFVPIGERTKAVINPVKDKELLQFAKSDFENVKGILKDEGKIDDRFRPSQSKVFDTKALEAIRKMNMNALDKEDTWFMQAAYDSSLTQYMKSNKIKPSEMVGDTLEKGRTYAMNEALKATYRDFNSLASAISRTKSRLANGEADTVLGSFAKKAGGVALEGALPFTKTPLNIIKRGLAYSPAGLVRGIVNLADVKKGTVTATEAIDRLSSGLSGSTALALGTWLGYNGIVQGKNGEYNDKLYDYNTMQGSQNYSLNIGGKSYTLDWSAPISMPFFVGVELAKAVQDSGANLANVIDSMTSISDPMVNLSMLKGMNDLIKNNYDGFRDLGSNLATGYLGQYVPTLAGQVARTTDATRRSTTSTNESNIGRKAERFGRQQIAKLPIASRTLEPYIDLWGRTQKNSGIVQNFLSPGNYKEQNVTFVDKELNALIKGLDEETAKQIAPRDTTTYDIIANGNTYRMNEKELTKFKQTRGQEAYNKLQNLFRSAQYRTMDSGDKVREIKGIYDDAFTKAKAELLNNRGESPLAAYGKSANKKYNKYIVKSGMSQDQYVSILNRLETADKDGNGRVSKAEAQKVLVGLPSKQKQAILDSI